MVTTIIQLLAESREGTGKGPNNALRRKGRIPGIIYGGGREEVKISTNLKEFTHEFMKGHFTSKVVELKIGDETIRTLPRDVQLHPVSDVPLHADFQRIHDHEQVRVYVAVQFINADKSPGLKRGGVLNIVRRDVELLCDVNSIPSKLIADLAELQIGHSIHISNITLPSGATPTITDRDFTIATVVGRKEEKEETDTNAVPAVLAEAAAADAAKGEEDSDK